MKITAKTILMTVVLLLPVLSYARDIYVDTPDSCYSVQEIKNNKISLIGTNDKCIGVSIKIPIKVEDTVTKVDIYVNGNYWKSQELSSFDTDSVSKSVEAANTYSNNYKVPENIHQKKADITAKKLDEFYRSPEFQNKIAAETKRLEENVFNPILGKGNNEKDEKTNKGYYQDKIQTVRHGKLPINERLYLFISSSLPETTLRNYVAALDRLKDPNITGVLNGFVGGAKYVAPTMRFIKNILVKSPGCEPMKESCDMYNANISIDPMLFTRYSITKVPAVVYVPNTSVADQFLSEGHEYNAKHNEHYVLYGDASLDYLIEVIYEHTKQKSLESVLAILRKGYY